MYIIPFTSPEATLETAGGKGANLVRLTRAGFDVPRGFILSTNAYREFVEANKLDVVIQQAMEELASEAADALENASQTIRSAFSQGDLPSAIHQEIQTAYAELNPKSLIENRKSVAVRSSATAEDLPDFRSRVNRIRISMLSVKNSSFEPWSIAGAVYGRRGRLATEYEIIFHMMMRRWRW